MQGADVVGQVDLDVVGVHDPVAVDVDLERRIAAGHVDPGLRMRRRRRSVERRIVHEMDRSGG